MISWVGKRLLRVFREARHIGYAVEAVRRRCSAQVFGVIIRLIYGAQVSFRAYETLPSEVSSRWADLAAEPIRLSIIVVSYKQPIALQCLLSSLACQVLQNFEVLVYHDGPDPETKAVVERFEQSSDRFRYHETARRYNDWGHSLRELGIQEAQGEYLLITNGDNYYVPRFTQFAFDAVKIGCLDMVLWDLIHSYTSSGQKTLRCYTPFRVFPARYVVDIAAVMVRSDLARQVGFVDHSHNGDATYVEHLLAHGKSKMRVGKVEKVLAVHN